MKFRTTIYYKNMIKMQFFMLVFIHELVIRLFDYSVFAASKRTDSAREGDAKILFNFEYTFFRILKLENIGRNGLCSFFITRDIIDS